ncbi:hypothetical protein HYC85_001724 [Camellia sinensis]|uniref:Major facilitator superfamily (MFS) profile domain-containing protein n=1 Tax=Camellia sinensis TaxID=4442 RepID=A0A7J7I6T2_CAMSI|nr:hypothetical protein HYC85_001724 [Camellia sinensis]
MGMMMMMMKSETLTLILVNLAGIMERADESLLPGVYKEVGAALHTDPTGLGSLTLFRSVVQSFCYPLAACLAVRHNRAHVISLGAFLWAAATFLVAISSTYFEVAVSRGLSGIGLAIVTPAIQSLVADSTDEANRDKLWFSHPFICNTAASPIFAEIVPERSRTTIYALDQSFESILSSFAPPLVGILAQHVFGYKPIRKGSTDSEEIETDRENAAPLAKALYAAIGVPYVICCLIYSFLYCSYPRDREQARMRALMESEMQQIMVNPPSREEEYSQLHVLGSDELQERIVIELDYEGEESLDFDENEEKRFLFQ